MEALTAGPSIEHLSTVMRDYSIEVYPKPSPLLRLPLELRREIYKYSLITFRHPPSDGVHNDLLANVWEDVPSPLLIVNKQIRTECIDIVRRSTFPLRVTWQDMKFDGLALSRFAMENRRPTYDNLSGLVVEVWPPHPDRPIDAHHIWKHLRTLRNDLAQIPQIQKLDIQFLENDLATWTDESGNPQQWLIDDSYVPGGDIGAIVGLFARLTNVSSASFRLPHSLAETAHNEALHEYAYNTVESMTGLADPIKGPDDKTADFFERYIEKFERILQSRTAITAREKLDVLTDGGERKMSVAAYERFVRVWPHLEMLTSWDVGGEFAGMWHYAEGFYPDEMYFSQSWVVEG